MHGTRGSRLAGRQPTHARTGIPPRAPSIDRRVGARGPPACPLPMLGNIVPLRRPAWPDVARRGSSRGSPLPNTLFASSPLRFLAGMRILLRISCLTRWELRCRGAEQDHLRLRRRPPPLPARAGARRRQPLGRDRGRPPSLRRCRGRAGERGSTRSPFASALATGRKVRFTGVLLGEWINTSYSRVETFRVYRGRTGKFVLHIERSPDYTDGRRRGQAGRLARLPRDRQHQLRATSPRSRPSRSSRPLEELRDRIPPQLYDMVAGSAEQPAGGGPRHLTSRHAGRRASAWHDGHPVAGGDPRHRAAQVVRQAGRPRRHRPRGRRRAPSSPCSDRTAPARRPRSTSSRR